MKEGTYITSNFGIRIRKCCASCAKMEYDTKKWVRKCRANDVTVHPSEICEKWELKPVLVNEGGLDKQIG